MPNFEITDAMSRTHIVNAWTEEQVTHALHGTDAEFEMPPHERDHVSEFDLPDDMTKLRAVLLVARRERLDLRAQRMKRKLRPITAQELVCITMALGHLKEARTYLKRAHCPKTLAKIHSALKSTEGAHRHAERRLTASKAKPAA